MYNSDQLFLLNYYYSTSYPEVKSKENFHIILQNITTYTEARTLVIENRSPQNS